MNILEKHTDKSVTSTKAASNKIFQSLKKYKTVSLKSLKSKKLFNINAYPHKDRTPLALNDLANCSHGMERGKLTKRIL